MRIALALLTAVAAVAAATSWLVPGSSENQLAIVTDVGVGGVARVTVPVSDRSVQKDGVDHAVAVPRFFGFPLPFAVTERSGAKVEADAPPAPSAWVTEVVPAPMLARQQAASIPAASEVQPSAALVVTKAPGPAPVIALPRERAGTDLIRDLQRELKRVGCYAGDLDGEWGPGSRRSLQAFMDRMNSSLPSTHPDLIQLTLVRGYAGVACGAPCPPDRVGPAGRCLEGPIMAARPATDRADARRAAPSVAANTSQAAPSRMPVASEPIVTGSTSTAVVAPMSVVPLEGRMAMGAPLPPPGEPSDMAPITAVPTAPRVAKPRAPSTQTRRPDRSWTASFFDRQ